MQTQIFDKEATRYKKARTATKKSLYKLSVRKATGDQCQLFKWTDTLHQNNANPVLSRYDSPTILANDLAQFFTGEITKIQAILPHSPDIEYRN